MEHSPEKNGSSVGFVARLGSWVQRWPLLTAWLVILITSIVVLNDLREIPPYHDGLTNWAVAEDLAEHPWFPFREAWDTGHPPLISWSMAVLWKIGLPKLEVMHILLWMAWALLLASVFEIGRRSFDASVGFFAMMMMVFHPVVLGQSFQINLDLFVAAFGIWAIAGAATGSPVIVAVALTLGTMSKLSGMFILGPFMIYAFVSCLRNERWKDARYLWNAWWPLLAPLAVFAVYHAVKYLAVGHVFDDGKYEGGNQIGFVPSSWEYWIRIYHSWYMTFQENGNQFAFVISIGLLLGLAAAAIRSQEVRQKVKSWALFNADEHSSKDSASNAPWHRKLDPLSLLALLWLTLIVQLLLQSIREVYSLIRYFIICYPAIYITLFGIIALLFSRWRWQVQTGAAFFMVAIFVIKWHPGHITYLQDRLESMRVPQKGVATSGEENLLFLRWFDLLHDAAEKLERYYPEGAEIIAPWPFIEYLMRPEFEITDVANTPSPEDRVPEAIFKFSAYHLGVEIEDVEIPEGWYVERVFQDDRIWCILILPDKFKDPEDEEEADVSSSEESTVPQISSDQPDA